MKRYYISPVIGTGTFEDPYRAKLAEHGVPFVAVIPTGPDGKPLFNWCLCLAAGSNHAKVLADGQIDALPDFPLDAKMAAMQNLTLTRLRNALKKRNVPASVTDNSDGYRDSIRALGRQLDPAFDENAFDVVE